MIPKPIRKHDKDVLRKTRTMPCLVCQHSYVDACHVISKGAGGPDEQWNLMPLCRAHHIQQHQQGLGTFLYYNFRVKQYLIQQGWIVDMTTARLIYNYQATRPAFIIDLTKERQCQTL